MDVDKSVEHGVLPDAGKVTIHAGEHAQALDKNDLAHIPPGSKNLRFSATSPTRIILIGGRPFEEKTVMRWNLVGRGHDEIVQYRGSWQGKIGAADASSNNPGIEAGTYVDGKSWPRSGAFPKDKTAPLPAPTLPNVRINAQQSPNGVGAVTAQNRAMEREPPELSRFCPPCPFYRSAR